MGKVNKAKKRRDEIIEASRRLFMSQGYENTTMQDIMTTCQIAKGTTYHYFKSKEDILHAVVDHMVSEYIGLIEKSLEAFQGSALDKMKQLMTASNVSTSNAEMLEDIHRSDNRDLHALLLASTLLKLAPIYAAVIKQGCDEGVFQVEHPLECAEMLIAGIQFITDIGCYPWHEADLTRRHNAMSSLIENQLNAPSGAFQFLSSNLTQEN